MKSLSKVPPHSIELEKAILGAIILERDALIEAGSEIKSDYFYKESHKQIADAVLDLFRLGENVDMLTVSQELKRRKKIEEVGGFFYLTELTDSVSSSAHLMNHIKLIQEMWIKREMIRLAGEIQSKGFDESEDAFELMDRSQMQLINLLGGMLTQNAISLRQSTSEVMQELSNNMARRLNNEFTGIPTPIDNLNKFTGGWQKGELIILAARPAMGKTALALAFARAAAKSGSGVLFFSLEMPHNKLTYRIIAQETKKKTMEEMQTGKITDSELNALTLATSRLTNYQIYIDDQASLSLMALRSKATRMKATGNLEMIIVDYLQLMSDDSRSSGNREQEISRISRGLKVLAKDLSVPVIALSQLSRAVETRGGDKKPQLSDLRESGAIEQDADMVIFLYRPEYYGIQEMEFDSMGTVSTKNLAIGSIAKNRNGSTGDFLMTFNKPFVDFTNFSIYEEQAHMHEDKFNWPSGEKNFF